MKKPSFLFLFFLWGMALIGQGHMYSQNSNDSLKYYHHIITTLENGNQLNRAFRFFENLIESQIKNGETIPAVQNLRRVAIGQYELGFLYESEATALRALQLLEPLETNETIQEAKSGLFNHMGIVYRQLKAYDKSLSYYQKALEYALDQSDSIPTMNNMFYVYIDQGKYPMALKNAELILEKRLKKGDSLGIARALDNLGYVQSNLKMPLALDNLQRALLIRQSKHDLSGMYATYHHLSEHFQRMDSDQEALHYAEQAYILADSIQSTAYMEDALSLLLDLSKDPKVVAYKKLTDSISSAKQARENKYAMFKYNVEKEREKTQAAELRNEREKTYKTIFISAFILAVMAGLFGIYRKNQQRKREIVLAAQRAEARISKSIHDNLANDISGVITFVERKVLISNSLKEQLLCFLDNIYFRARDISVANAGIDVTDFPTTLKNLISQYHPKGMQVVTSPYDNINWNAISEHKKVAVYKCLQELLVNTKKHSNATLISIAFKNKGKKNEIVYSDNGIGFEPGKKSYGGLVNVETRMNEIGGSFSFESNKDKGFKATLLV